MAAKFSMSPVTKVLEGKNRCCFSSDSVGLDYVIKEYMCSTVYLYMINFERGGILLPMFLHIIHLKVNFLKMLAFLLEHID